MFSNLLQDFNFHFALPITFNIGGVGIFVHKSFMAVIMNDLNLNCSTVGNLVESLFLEISKGKDRFIVGGLYRHPSHDISNFCLSLENTLQSSKLAQNVDCFLIGDLNIDLLKYDSSETSRFIDMLIHIILPLFQFAYAYHGHVGYPD